MFTKRRAKRQNEATDNEQASPFNKVSKHFGKSTHQEMRQHPRQTLICPVDYLPIEKGQTLSKNQLVAKFFGTESCPYFSLVDTFQSIDNSPCYNLKHPSLKQLKQKSKENFQALVENLYPNSLPQEREVNVSQGGLRFNHFLSAEVNQDVYVLIKIDSYPVPLFIRAMVIACEPIKNSHYRYELTFAFTDDTSKEAWLIKRELLHTEETP